MSNRAKKRFVTVFYILFDLCLAAFLIYCLLPYQSGDPVGLFSGTQIKLSDTDALLTAAESGELPFAVPAHDVSPYTPVNGGLPYFSESELTAEPFEEYGDLDLLGRCTTAYACIGKETMPTEPRGSIGMIKPTGWHTVKYDIIDYKYLYNRCHLIAYQLSGENANEKNLITGTRYLNVSGMLPFENRVADYVEQTGNHVLYRVTPVFLDINMVANGVLMEAYSVEDRGAGICFCVFVHNIQPGIEIDYLTGESRLK